MTHLDWQKLNIQNHFDITQVKFNWVVIKSMTAQDLNPLPSDSCLLVYASEFLWLINHTASIAVATLSDYIAQLIISFNIYLMHIFPMAYLTGLRYQYSHAIFMKH